MRKIKTGLIGGGFVGRVHAEALRRLGYVEVHAIAEADQYMADSKAEELSIPNAYGDYRDLLKNRGIEVVHVLTPNVFHYEMAKNCIEAGKHVVVEKPLSVSTKESADLVRLSRKQETLCALSHNMRYYPLVKQARELVRAGGLGTIYMIHGAYLQDWLSLETDWSWRLRSEFAGTSRVVADIGIHWLDMVQHVTGQRVISLCADISTFMPVRKKPLKEVETFATFTQRDLRPEDFEDAHVDTEDHGHMMLRFSDGAKGLLLVSMMAVGRKNMIRFEINGSKRSVAWNGEEPNHLWIGERERENSDFIKNPEIMSPEAARYAGAPAGLGEGYLDTFKNIFGDIYTWILEGKRMDESEVPFPTFADGHQLLLVVDAAFKSHASGRWTDVEKTD